MAFERMTPAVHGAVRLGIGGGGLAFLFVHLASAMAQSSPALPSAPALPSGIPTALPSALPSAMPSLPFGGSQRPPPLPPPAVSDETPPAAPRRLPPPRPSDVILLDEGPSSGPDQVAGKLPKGLHGNAEVERRKEVDNALGLKAETPVVTASNRNEDARAALGSIIVLTRQDIVARGYTDLSQLLDDLPGVDVVRPWGDVYVRSYVRGYRSTGADPFVLLLDGVEMNQLFTRSTQILAALPLSAIERVEIVLGPLSSVWGMGAPLGAIHVITARGRDRQEAGYQGGSLDARATFGGPQRNLGEVGNATKIVDATASYLRKDLLIRLAARLESGAYDVGAGQGYNFTKPAYYQSASAWGAGTLAAYPAIAGALPSPDRKGAVDARVFLGRSTEVAAQFFTLSTGYGVAYPGDRRQAAGLFTSREWSAYARHTGEVTSGVASSTLIQFRKSDIDAQSLSSDGTQVKWLDVVSPSSAVVVRQDFEINTRRGLLLTRDQLAVGLGVRYRHLALPASTTGYDVVSSTVWAPSADPRVSAVAGSDEVTGVALPGKTFDEMGSYLLARYAFNPQHHVHAGAGVDWTSVRNDVNVSVRTGYAGTLWDMLTLKVWYGHAMFEPSRQEDLAATVASKTTPTLQASSMHSVEGDVDVTLPAVALHVDGYFTYAKNPVVAFQPSDATAGTLVNLKDRRLAGIDAGARMLLKPVHLWAYYSHVFAMDDGLPTTALAGQAATNGDSAADKIWAGITVNVGPFRGTVLNRWALNYKVVPTNLAGAPDFHGLLDAHLMLSDVPAEGLWFALRATNLVGSAYHHPGIQTADAGNANTTGFSSAGPYSAWLPQPGRGFFFTVGYRFEHDKSLHEP